MGNFLFEPAAFRSRAFTPGFDFSNWFFNDHNNSCSFTHSEEMKDADSARTCCVAHEGIIAQCRQGQEGMDEFM